MAGSAEVTGTQHYVYGIGQPMSSPAQPVAPPVEGGGNSAVAVNEGARLNVYGNSFGVSPGLACTAGNEYFNRLKARLAIPTSLLATYAISGSGLYEVCYDLNGAHTTGTGPSVAGSAFSVTKNGLMFLNALTNMYTNPAVGGAVQAVSADYVLWLQYLTRSIFATMSAGTRIEETAATTGGTWTTFTTDYYSGGAVKFSSTTGAYMEWSVTVPTGCDSAWVMAYMTDDGAAFKVSVDGVDLATFTQPATKPTVRSFRFNNFGTPIVGPVSATPSYSFPVFTKVPVTPGTRVIRITKTDSNAAAIVVDGLLLQRPAANLPQIVTYLDPLPNPVGAQSGRAEVVGRVQFAANKALIDPAFKSVCTEFSNVALVDASDLLDLGGVSAVDNLHPNDPGMLIVANRSAAGLPTQSRAGLYSAL